MSRRSRLPAAIVWGMGAGARALAVVALVCFALIRQPTTRIEDGEVIHLKGGDSNPRHTAIFFGCVFAVGAGVCGALWRYTQPE